MLIFDYPTKKILKTCIGKELRFRETSFHGFEYPGDGNGILYGCNRPHLTGHKREFFAKVTLENHKIVKVS